MDEILFRGKVVDESAWAEGFFVYCSESYNDEELRIPEIISANAKRIYAGEYEPWECYPVLKGTVSQWTGLIARNGVKIFEGDILESIVRRVGKPGERIVVKDIRDCKDLASCTYQYEVIGNIWDNPKEVQK